MRLLQLSPNDCKSPMRLSRRRGSENVVRPEVAILIEQSGQLPFLRDYNEVLKQAKMVRILCLQGTY